MSCFFYGVTQMIEFTREQKKEFLMQELELIQEVKELEKKLNHYCDYFKQLTQYLDMIIQDGKSLNIVVPKISEDDIRQGADVNEILCIGETLKRKRGELHDVQAIVRMIRD